MNPASSLSKACRRGALVVRSHPRAATVAASSTSRFLSHSTPRPLAQPIDLSSHTTVPASSVEESSLSHDVLSQARTDVPSQHPSSSSSSTAPTTRRPTTPDTSAREAEELSTTSPFLLTGTVSRTGTMASTVQITRHLQIWDKHLQKHYTRPAREKVHDPHPAGYLREGDVVEFGLFSESERAQRSRREAERVERAAAREARDREDRRMGVRGAGKVLRGGKWKVEGRNKWKVRFVVRRVVTPFGVGLEERSQGLVLGDAQQP